MQHFGFETVIATGGVKTGLDIAKAITLGATMGGVARPVLQALERGGRDGAAAMLGQIVEEIRVTMLLVGARNVTELGRAPRIVTGELVDWMRQKF